MKASRVEGFARQLAPSTTDSVRAATVNQVVRRLAMLPQSVGDVEAARTAAAQLKSHVLDNLGPLLEQLEANCERNGIQVHWAEDAREAREIILRLAGDRRRVVKAKSMATEEIHLNPYLEERGFEVTETDLGEYVVQIDGDRPSHIVAPIIHKSLKQVAESFSREGLGPYSEVAEELTMQARAKLRSKFREAEVGISGVNFAIAETGRLVLVENEGNNRFSTTAPEVHIALMGLEKVLPRETDLALFLRLLAASATGQQVTTYTHFIAGPRRGDETDGPREVHLVILDNGRSRILEGPYRDILRCIRCGACLNVCPVYRQASGHAYGHVYSGPLGAVLAPALEGVAALGDLAKASTLCGACEEVCPVKIPIPAMLLDIRRQAAESESDSAPWAAYALGATRPALWRAGLTMLPLASKVAVHPMKSGWAEFRELPARTGRDFRRWQRGRS